MTASVFINGRFCDEVDATVGIDDGGLLHGAGLFETMRAENGCIFRLESHMERLQRSAAALLMPVDRRALPAVDIFRELLERCELTCARVRLTLTAGSVQDRSDSASPAMTIFVTATELADYPPEVYENGVGVAICDHRVSPSDPLAAHKTTCYFPRLLGLRRARHLHCSEALWFTTTHQLAEGCLSNVFIVRDGALKTPPLETPVLPGIARSVVLEIAGGIGVDATETTLTIDDLLDADEVFLTNSIMQVLPVTRVEKRDIGSGRVGPIARRLLDEYKTCVKKGCRAS